MKNITTFLLGGLVFISFAATTTNVMAVKPATPKGTVVIREYSDAETVVKIKNYIKRGYILKAVSGGGGDYHQSWIVVMEKY